MDPNGDLSLACKMKVIKDVLREKSHLFLASDAHMSYPLNSKKI
jgi:hypothetical protein